MDFGSFFDPGGFFDSGDSGSGSFPKSLEKMMAAMRAKQAAMSVQPTLLEMPTLTSADSRLAKRRSASTQLARKGRGSTILTEDDTLGVTG